MNLIKNNTPLSLASFVSKNLVTTMILLFLLNTLSFSQLPVWPLVTADTDFQNSGSTAETEHQYVDWDAGSTSISMTGTLANSKGHGGTQAGLNECGDLKFFVMHNGTTNPNSLEVFNAAGDQLTLSPSNINANKGDDEIQVVKRPGFTNQYYIIYSIKPTAAGNEIYIASNLGYSIIEVDVLAGTANYVTIGTVQQKDIVLMAPPADDENGADAAQTYIHGKAVSRTSVTAAIGHDLYIQRRAQNSTSFSIDRFEITAAGIAHNWNSGWADPTNPTIAGYWWALMVSGSPIELSPDESKLAVMARHQNDNTQTVYLFDLTSQLSNVAMDEIIFDDLLIEPDVTNAATTGYVVAPGNYASYNDANGWGAPNSSIYLSYLDYLECKISSIEFSENGNYLYFVGGGYQNAGFGNITTLGQIDLVNTYVDPSNVEHFIVRLQVQDTPGWDTGTYGRQAGTGTPWTLLNNVARRTAFYSTHNLSRIQLSYDGNIYFTKNNSEQLFVLPNPNNPMPVNLVPGNIDLSTAANPNIPTNGYALYLPDQIDGYDYKNINYDNVSFEVSNHYFCSCDTLTIHVIDQTDNSIYGIFYLTECPTTLSFCAEANSTYDLVGSNGVTFENAISSATPNYPTGQSVFNFGNSTSTNATFITATNTHITSDEIWDGKWFIPSGMIITVDDALLDLTNVDLVFGECAGIDFINDGSLRANNSVFRPCEVGGSWRGLYFSGDGNDHIVNECTFKNAEKALYFNKGADGVVSENLFSNCNVGVHVAKDKSFNHPISGNRFVIDDFYPRYPNCYEDTDTGLSYGVLCSNTLMLSEISQNEFIYSKNDDLIASYGVHCSTTSTIISKNIFTNYRNPITIIKGTKNSSVDGNEIEVNAQFTEAAGSGQVAGISIFDSEEAYITVSNNQLRNNSNSEVFKDAIYVSKSNRVSIVANTIDGFYYSIRLSRTLSAEVSNNEITRGLYTGILAIIGSTETEHFITCNDITMELGTGKFGIRVRKGNLKTQITGNCIKDTKTAIAAENAGSTTNDIPYIRNNYLYNYTMHGIYSNGHTGNIGAAGDPGMNTLWSNDNSAVDIASVGGVIQVADNFGMFLISYPDVQITSNNPSHSTASCGTQIYNMPSQGNLNTSLNCENSEELKSFLFANDDFAFLRSDYLELLIASKEQYHFISFLLSNYTGASVSIMKELINASEITDTESAFIRYQYYSSKHDFINARIALNSVSNLSINQEQYKELCSISLDIAENGNDLTVSQVSFLESTAYAMGEHQNEAIALLRATPFHPSYFIDDVVLNELATNIKTIEVESDMELKVYPNPASDVLFIEFLANINEDNDINIMDVTGHLIDKRHLDFKSGKFQLDVLNLSSGAYFIEVIDNSGNRKVAKFIKE